MSFTGIQDPATRKAVEDEIIQRDKQIPFLKFQYVDVNFTAANQDFDISHKLAAKDPESVRYLVVKSSAALSVYQDLSGARKAWQTTHIYLRSSATGTVRLLLFLEA